jgi:hypothetical protein
MMFKHTAMPTTLRRTLKTSHTLDLKKENWLTEVKELLTPEKSSETKVLRVSAPLYQP